MKHPVSELMALAAEIRHVRAERSRRSEDSSWFRLHGARLDDLLSRFEQGVERWTPPEHRDAWRAHRDGGGEPPEAAPTEPAPLWWGRSLDGSILEVLPPPAQDRPRRGPGVRVRLDGDRQARVVRWSQAVVRIGDRDYTEQARCPKEAVEALRIFLGDGGDPPWSWARALLDDGLVDRDLSLTARGRRLVEAYGGPPSAGGPRWTRWVAG